MAKSAAQLTKLAGSFTNLLSTRFEDNTEVFPTLGDTFTRPNSSTAGSTELANGMLSSTWTPVYVFATGAAAFGIASNQLYPLGNNTVDTDLVLSTGGFTDGTVQLTVNTLATASGSGEVGLVVRHAGTNGGDHYLVIFRYNGLSGVNYIEIYRNVSGAYTSIAGLSTAGSGIVSGDVVKATFSGTTITAYRNGVAMLSVIDSTITTGSYVGVRYNGNTGQSGNRYDNFYFWPPFNNATGQLQLSGTAPVGLMSRASLSKPAYAVNPLVNMATGYPQVPLIECSIDSGQTWQVLTNKVRNYFGSVATSIRFRLTNQASTLVDTFVRPGLYRALYDNFGRTQSGLGTGDSGQTWQYAGSSTGFSTAGGYATQVANTSATNVAYFDTQLSTFTGGYAGFNTYDYSAIVDRGTIPAVYLLVRYLDASNHVRLKLDSSAGALLQKMVAGSATTLATGVSGAAGVSGTHTWRISVTPTTITVYRDGTVEIAQVLDTTQSTSTKVGWWMYDTGAVTPGQIRSLAITTSSYVARTSAELYASGPVSGTMLTSSGHNMTMSGSSNAPTGKAYITPSGTLACVSGSPSYFSGSMASYDRDISFIVDSAPVDEEWNLVLRRNASGSTAQYVFINAGGQIGIYDSSQPGYIITAQTFTSGALYRITVIGSTYTLYKNGVSVGTGTSSANSTSTVWFIKMVNTTMSYFLVSDAVMPMQVEDMSVLLEAVS